MPILPGETWVVDGNGARCVASLYPAGENAPALLRPLAAENTRLQRENEALRAQIREMQALILAADTLMRVVRIENALYQYEVYPQTVSGLRFVGELR